MTAASGPDLPPQEPRVPVRAALAVFCDIITIGIVLYVVVSRVLHADFGVSLVLTADRLVLLTLVPGFVVLRRLAPRIDPRLSLAAFTFLAAAGAGLIGLQMLGANMENRIRAALMPVKERAFALAFGTYDEHTIYQIDDRYGYVLRPNSTASQRGRRFRATLTIDAHGHRVMPSPATPRGTVVFLGDSFTLGDGVNDDETFSYVLAREHWKDLRVINGGVGGWGLTQFHLATMDLLDRSPRPTAILITVIPDDLRRSHLRPNRVVVGLRRRLAWMDGAFVPYEQPYEEAVIDETPELLEAETRQARSSFAAMAAATRASGVLLGVILLDDDTGYPPDLVYALAQLGIPVLDLSRLGHSALPYDGHPDPAGHRQIAAAIASSSLSGLIYSRLGTPDE